MKSICKHILRVVVTVTVLGIGACASIPEPIEYHDDRDEKPGPGLFSGPAGGYVITGQSGKTPVDTRNGSADHRPDAGQ